MSDPSDMIERVARAMTEAAIPTGKGGKRACWPEWDKLCETSREPWRIYAVAAIAAMREPSAAMWEAGKAALYVSRGVVDLSAAYRAMIDKALKD